MNRWLRPDERARLLEVGYDVTADAIGEDVARPVYRTSYNCAFLELALLDLTGREALAALDALTRLGGWAEAERGRLALIKRIGPSALQARRRALLAEGSWS